MSCTPQSAQAAPVCHFNILIFCLKNGFYWFKKTASHSSRWFMRILQILSVNSELEEFPMQIKPRLRYPWRWLLLEWGLSFCEAASFPIAFGNYSLTYWLDCSFHYWKEKVSQKIWKMTYKEKNPNLMRLLMIHLSHSILGKNISWAYRHLRIWKTILILLVRETPTKRHFRYLLRRSKRRT